MASASDVRAPEGAWPAQRLHYLPEVDSTNSWLKARAHDKAHGFTVFSHTQSAGRGQRGNTWESEPGKNLTFSTLLRPATLPAVAQFAISEAVCCGVATALRRHLEKCGMDAGAVKVKWPNDVYCSDRKIAGILIENTLSPEGLVAASVAGVGINVNQTCWISDAPNPVSLRGITGKDTPLEPLLEEVVGEILTLADTISSPQGRQRLHELYLRLLYRRDGLPHRFFIPSDIRRPVTIIPSDTDRHFEAVIKDVDQAGALVLRHPDGTLSSHLFKEVAFIISPHS